MQGQDRDSGVISATILWVGGSFLFFGLSALLILGWFADQLRGSVPMIATVVDFKAGRRIPVGVNMVAIQRTLEASGIAFIDGDEPGVQLRRP